MSELNSTIFGAISERSTLACMNAPNPPAIPRGKQTYKFEVGQTYQASGKGSLKAGTPIKIVFRYKQHGYAYYEGENGMVHREHDIS